MNRLNMQNIKKFDKKKEKHLIGIMRFVTVVLIVMFVMNCISSYDYKLDYKVPDTNGEKLEPIEVKNTYVEIGDQGKCTLWGIFFCLGYDLNNSSILIKKDVYAKYSLSVQGSDGSLLSLMLSFLIVVPYYNSHSNKDIIIFICQDRECAPYKSKYQYKIGKHSGWAIGWLPLIPVQFV